MFRTLSLIIFLLLSSAQADSSVYYKNMIKNRSKIHPENYNYAIVRKKSDLKHVKNRKFNPNSKKRVYNYVEIRNVKQSIFGRSTNNIGLNLNSEKKNRVVNIVKVKNSSINSNAQLGIKVKKSKYKKIKLNNLSINNQVEVKDSVVGNRKQRLIYKVYKLTK